MISKESVLQVVQGDLLKQPVEAIVNAANTSLEGGGGIDGLIHRAAGNQLVEACRQYKRAHGISKIEVGEAVVTESFEIKKSNPRILYVIHTVGPNCGISSQNRDKETLLRKAYQNSLEIAREKGIRSIAFPAISTGIYHYPFKEAQKVAMQAIEAYLKEHPDHFKEIRLTYYSESDYAFALQVLDENFQKDLL